MYIRIAASGDPACTYPGSCDDIQFSLKTTRGNPVPLSALEDIIFDGEEGTFRVGSATITKIPGSDCLFQVVVVDIGHLPSGWEIQLLNNTGEPLDIVWVVADNETDAAQPWLDVSSPLLDFNALGTILPEDSIPDTLTVINRGTGELRITGLEPSGDDFSLSGDVTIPANSCGVITLVFNAPSIPGTCDTTVGLSSNDSFAVMDATTKHNKEVVLEAYCGIVEILMVLDASGSMSLPAGGSAPEGSRWDRLVEAVSIFLDHLSIFSGGLGRIGIVLFPDPTDDNRHTEATSDPIHPSGPIGDIGDPLEEKTPSGRTPMGHGIETAFGQFRDDTSEQAYNNRWMVIMSDGAHNLDHPHPNVFCEAEDNPFQGQNIRVFAVAYGDAGDTIPWPPHQQMRDLAAASVGEDVDVDNFNYRAAGEHDEHALAHDFKEAIATLLALDLPEDPRGMLTSDRPEARHPVNILSYDTQAAFMVNWSSRDQERVAVQLLTPLCELITPGLAARDAHLQYYGHPSYVIYAVHRDFLRNASDPAHPRHGPWTLVVTGRGLEDGDQEAYTFNVVTRSNLKMRPRCDRPRYWAGDPITVSVRLLLNGKPIPDATVSMRVEAPGEAAQNWMARQKVSPKDFEKAEEQLKGRDVTALDIKTHAVLQQGHKFDPFARTRKIIMTDPSRQGVYSTTFTRTTVPGNYKFYITAVGQTPDRLLFRRERQIHQYLDVHPVADATFYHAGYRKIVDDHGESLQIDIRIWPRDPFNNVVLSPGEIHRRIVLNVEEAQSLGPLKDNLDGSYSAVFRCDVHARPAIDLKVNGHPVFDRQRLLPVARLHCADQVLEYKPGPISAGEGAAHDDPEAALGDATLKGDDDFVHLGLYGRLTLGVKDQAVCAGEGDDVVVFVRPSEDLCAYRVEALPVGSDTQWVALGTSPGVTRSFALGSAGIKAAKAIRIIDRGGRRASGPSGQGHGSGVAIQGMGFGKVGPLYEENDGCLAWPLTLIRRLIGSSR